MQHFQAVSPQMLPHHTDIIEAHPYRVPGRPAPRHWRRVLNMFVFLAGTWSSAATQAQDLAKLPDLVERIAPAVVSISAVGVEEKTASDQNIVENSGIFSDPVVREALRKGFDTLRPASEGKAKTLPKSESPAGEARKNEKPKTNAGSGMVLSADGYIVTASYTIEGASSITVTLDDGSLLNAEVIGVDPRTTVALLKVKPPAPLSAVKMADSNRLRRGQPVIAMGNPFGLSGSVTFGIVSAKSRNIGSGPYDYFQIDAAINRGNSGGPVFNLEGDVVGMATAIFSPTGGNVGVAFGIPSNLINEIVKDLKQSGTVERGWLGVKIQNVDSETAKALGLEKTEGALVNEITAGGPAVGLDLKPGDAILQVKGQKIADSRDLARTIAELRPKEKVDLVVFRGGKEHTVAVELGKFPSAAKPGHRPAPGDSTAAPAGDGDEFEGLDKLE